jgi:hypothetical protein
MSLDFHALHFYDLCFTDRLLVQAYALRTLTLMSEGLDERCGFIAHSETFTFEGGQRAVVYGRPRGLELTVRSVQTNWSRCILLLAGMDLVVDCKDGPERRAAREQWLWDATEKARAADFARGREL